MAEGVGFEPTVALRLLLISSQMPLTTQPPFLRLDFIGKKRYLELVIFTSHLVAVYPNRSATETVAV